MTRDEAFIKSLRLGRGEIIDMLFDHFLYARNCGNCMHSVKFPIYNMECHRNTDEYNPVFEIGIYPEFCCNKWEIENDKR